MSALPLFDDDDDDPGLAVCMHGVDILAACPECDGDAVVLEGETPEEYAARRLREIGATP